MGIKDKLKEQLKDKMTREQLSLLPSGFQSLGKIIIIKLDPLLMEKKREIADAYLNLFPAVRSIYINHGIIKGKFRIPENVEFLAGEEDPIVIHKEHGVIYKFDITEIMFSKGNLTERKFLTTLIQPGEVIVDMFAGIGYFSLPIAIHAPINKIYSIEINPVAYNYLVENVRLNHLEERIIPIHGDCHEEVLKLSNSGLKADRVIMGVFPAPKNYIKEALTLTRDSGTVYHYEGVVKKKQDAYLTLFREFEEIALANGFHCELKQHRFVKSYGPQLYHVVLDILVHRDISNSLKS